MTTVHPSARRSVDRYLRIADHLLPGRVIGLYLVGSSALGAYRHGKSDLDLVVVVDGRLSRAELRRVRAVQWLSGAVTGAPEVVRGRLYAPGTCNAAYVDAGDLSLPVSEIQPLVSHTGVELAVGAAFDVNPVVWKVLSEAGIAIRGPEPASLGLDPQPELLRRWNEDNLGSYWRRWADAAAAGRPPMSRLVPARWTTAWGVLGPPRLHHTIATGEVISKEAAGEYALAAFDERWHPIVHEGLAFLRDEPADPAFADRETRHRAAGAFAHAVIESALGR